MGETKIILKNVFFSLCHKAIFIPKVKFCYAWSGHRHARSFDLNPLSAQLLRNQRSKTKDDTLFNR
jgi:hypothetical protein